MTYFCTLSGVCKRKPRKEARSSFSNYSLFVIGLIFMSFLHCKFVLYCIHTNFHEKESFAIFVIGPRAAKFSM